MTEIAHRDGVGARLLNPSHRRPIHHAPTLRGCRIARAALQSGTLTRSHCERQGATENLAGTGLRHLRRIHGEVLGRKTILRQRFDENATVRHLRVLWLAGRERASLTDRRKREFSVFAEVGARAPSEKARTLSRLPRKGGMIGGGPGSLVVPS